MNNLALESTTLAQLHTGLAQIVDNKTMPNMNFDGQVNAVEENLNITASRLNFQ